MSFRPLAGIKVMYENAVANHIDSEDSFRPLAGIKVMYFTSFKIVWLGLSGFPSPYGD